MTGKTETRWGGLQETEYFCPSVLMCVKCELRISTKDSSFMLQCCGKELICWECSKGLTKVECRLCGAKEAPMEIRASFFENIFQEADRIITKQSDRGSITEGKYESYPEPILENSYEEDWVARGRWAMKKNEEINLIMKDYNHANRCKIYPNILYLCDSVSKIRNKGHRGMITIHDILAFECLACGHGHMDRVVRPGGEITKMGSQSWEACRKTCCGMILDRRNLQLNEGNCNCGLLVLEQLDITPANEAQMEWRRNLVMGTHTSKQRVRQVLSPYLESIELAKPYMVIWFIMSKGPQFLETLKQKERKEIIRYLKEVAGRLSCEFGVHRPVQ